MASVPGLPNIPKLNSESVKELIPELWIEVEALLPVKIAEYTATEKAKEESEKKAKELIDRKKRDELYSKVWELVSGLGISITVDWVDTFTLILDKFSIRAEYNGKVYSNSIFDRGRESTRPWVVHDTRQVRFSTLEKAVAYMVKRLNEKESDAKTKAEVEATALKYQETLKKTLAEINMALDKETHGYHENGGNRGKYCQYDTLHVVAKVKESEIKYGPIVQVRGLIEKNIRGEIAVRGVTIHGQLTLEQFKKLVDYVKELNIAGMT